MSYTISNGAVLQTLFRGTLYGQDVMNTFHYVYDGPVIPSGLLALINISSVNATMQANMALWRDCVSADVIDMRIVVQWIFPLRFRAFTTPMVPNIGNGGASLTANTASVVTLVADQASRHGIGNKHLPGLPTGSLDNGFLTNGQVVSNQDFGTAMASSILGFMGGALHPVIYNRAAPASSLLVVGAEVNPTVRVQRRRTVGLGK